MSEPTIDPAHHRIIRKLANAARNTEGGDSLTITVKGDDRAMVNFTFEGNQEDVSSIRQNLSEDEKGALAEYGVLEDGDQINTQRLFEIVELIS